MVRTRRPAIPAANISTPYPEPAAAEVFQERQGAIVSEQVIPKLINIEHKIQKEDKVNMCKTVLSTLKPTRNRMLDTSALHHRKLTGKIGLTNLKNTCYFNAVAQCLLGCSLLRELIINPPHIDSTESCFNRRMQVLFKEMTKPGRKQPWSPQFIFDDICTSVKCDKYKSKTQQDAAEFLCYMIDTLTEENDAAGRLFTADQQSVTKCEGCRVESGVEETFTMLPLDIEVRVTNTVYKSVKTMN